MAFTLQERSWIRQYLGLPDFYLTTNTLLENALDLVGSQDESATVVRQILTNIQAVEAQIADLGIQLAGLKSAGKGDIEYYQGMNLTDLQRLGNMYCGQLSIKMSTKIVAPYFGGTGVNANVVDGLRYGFFN